MDCHRDEQDFDNLLEDISTIDHHHHLSVTFSDKLNLNERERTREESYQETIKKVSHLKIEQSQLRRQLQALKRETYRNYLYRFQEELQELNQENAALRKELHQSALKKKEDKNERMSNRSSFKVRSSVNSVVGDENKRTHTKAQRKNASPNVLLKKKQIKLAQSTTFLGRSEVTSPVNHKRRQSQLTQRKVEEKQHHNTLSNNCSFADDKYSQCNFKGSVSRQSLRPQQDQKNVFVQILEKMLKEEMALDRHKYAEIYLQSTREPVQPPEEPAVHINTLEKQIKESNDKLEMLNLVVNRYRTEIQGMNLNIRTVTDLTTKLYEVKGRYVEMQKKCQQLGALRKEVRGKEGLLREKQEEQEAGKGEAKTIASVETLIKIFTNNPQKVFAGEAAQLYSGYHKELKQLFKFDKEDQAKRQQKMVKVKEMIDSIRQNRKKFNELINIYETRIKKLQEKIGRVKQQQQSHSAKQSSK